MKAIVIGASAGVGRALAQQLAQRGDELIIIARDERDLSAQAADLRLRFGAQVHVLAADVADPPCEQIYAFALAALGRIDALFLIAGITDRSDRGIMTDAALALVANTNFVGPVRAANALLPLCGRQTDIVAASSVATIRPRGNNMVYGAAKLALEQYLMATRHGFGAGLRSVRCYRLGYIKTAMTFGQSMTLPAASPESVASVMIKNLGRSGVVYFPIWWALIALILRLLPWAIFKRMRI